jgi:integrase
MTTGMRRGELCGLRFSRIDFDTEVIDLRRNWVLGKEKDTKTHQNRRIALDSETIVPLREYEARARNRLKDLALRHYSATELLTAGVDLPTVARPTRPRRRRSNDVARLCSVGGSL